MASWAESEMRKAVDIVVAGVYCLSKTDVEGETTTVFGHSSEDNLWGLSGAENCAADCLLFLSADSFARDFPVALEIIDDKVALSSSSLETVIGWVE